MLLLLWTLWWMPRSAYPLEMQRKSEKRKLFFSFSKLQAEPIQLNANDLWRTMGLSPSCTIRSLLWNAKTKPVEMGFRQKTPIS